MAEPSSTRLADALYEAGFFALASRARQDEFHDYQSPHDTPVLKLVEELTKLQGADPIIKRITEGEFDADLQESRRWWGGQ